MKNVTITLDDEIAARAEGAAARRGKSPSEFVQELIERKIGRDAERGNKTDLEIMQEFLGGRAIRASVKIGAGERSFMLSVWMSLNVAVNATIRAIDRFSYRHQNVSRTMRSLLMFCLQHFIPFGVIPGRGLLPASPESITTGWSDYGERRGYGFRVRARARPGMTETTVRASTPAE